MNVYFRQSNRLLRRGLSLLLCALVGAAAAEELAETVPASLSVKLGSAVQTVPIVSFELKRRGLPPGAISGVRIRIDENYQLRTYIALAMPDGENSAWTLMLNKPVRRREVELILKLMAARNLDNFDAVKVSEKCKTDAASAAKDGGVSEVLAVRYAGCEIPAVIAWSDLQAQAKAFKSVTELAALNEALDEIVALAVNETPEKSPLREMLKR